METFRNTTLVFLVKKTGDRITAICLAMKKRGFGTGRWNGVGGKVEVGETIEAAAKREASEEIGIAVGRLTKAAELTFDFVLKPEWNQISHVYLVEEWEGEPQESEEMRPAWFELGDIPFESMWPDDPFWLPHVLDGHFVRAAFSFGEGDAILSKDIEIV